MSQMVEAHRGYLGNPLIRAAGSHTKYTPEQVREFSRCMSDPVHFIRNYVKLVHVDRGLVLFDMYGYQEDLVRTLDKDRFVICKLPRQVGKTVTVAAYLLHFILFNPEKKVAVLAHKLDQSKEILARIQKMYMHLPNWLKQGVVEWNKTSATFENGSKIIAAATSSSAIRGDSFNMVYLDEFAFVPQNQADEFFASVYPTISSGQTTKVLITSTPKGMNHFYKMWTDAVEQRSGYTPVEINWNTPPGRDADWMKDQISKIGEMKFDQEFRCEFIGSADTLISGPVLRALAHVTPNISTQEGLDIYESPRPGHQYVVVADVSRGVGIDYSAFVVIDVTRAPYKVVAKFRNNQMPPMVFPDVVHRVANSYNKAWTLIEVNDSGGQIADILYEDYEYDHLVMTANRGRKGQVADSGFGGAKVQFGVKTTKSVKRVGCSILKTMIEDQKLIVQDFDCIYELSTFVARGVGFEADFGQHDDLVMCMVLFGWLTTQPMFKEMTDTEDARRDLYEERLKNLEETMTPFGFINDGIHDDEGSFVDDGGTRWTVERDSMWSPATTDQMGGHNDYGNKSFF